ncbi:MAG TPA: hypothetical protein VLE47_01320 [Candidatus Saccharimonadales bacterium]|nr:hypothetical protein [Candidatus Saccharimonadales bacterium]
MENTPLPPAPTQPPVPPTPPAPGGAQGEVVAGFVPASPNSIPQVQAKGGTPWFVWLLASCGGCILIFIALIVIAVVAINPVKRVGDAQDSFVKAQVDSLGKEVLNCISGETAKGSSVAKIYSQENCASESFLAQNYPSDKVTVSSYSGSYKVDSGIILVNDSKNKICVYNAYKKIGANSESVVSWDSDTKVVTTAGKKTCI